MKRVLSVLFILSLLLVSFACAEEEKSTWGRIGDWFSNAKDDVADWASETAGDVWDWTTGAAGDVWRWTAETASGAWNGVTGFFDPPDTSGIPSIPAEPELPEGVQKMYIGYMPVNTGLDNGYSGQKEIGRGDPHFGLSIGKFYISGFTSALCEDGQDFIFLKTVGDDLQLHFELAQDITMLGGDTFVTINPDVGGYDKEFGIPPTDFGRGTLIVRHTDYQNKVGEAQIYADYLAGKMNAGADTVISLNEEGDYEIALDYEIRSESYVLGTKKTTTDYSDYRISFRFSVRNGNCMVFPFDSLTGEELSNTSVTQNGFRLDLAYSRYLDIMVKHSVLTENDSVVTEDVRFNRPAREGEDYTEEGLYTITVSNRYTGAQTVKTLYVGSDDRYTEYVSSGLNVEQIIQALAK